MEKNTKQNDLSSLSKEQLRKKITKAMMFIDKGSDYKAFYFDDMGLGIHICEHFVLLSRPFNDIVYARVTGQGYSKPCMYLGWVVDIANKYKDKIQGKGADGGICYSFRELIALDCLTEAERIIVRFFFMYAYYVSDPIYSIGNSPLDFTNMLTLFFSYQCKIEALTQERDADATRNDFFNDYITLFRHMSLGCQLDKEKTIALKNKIVEVEKQAYETIKSAAVEMGGVLENTIALRKDDMSEEEALNEMKTNDRSREDAAESMKNPEGNEKQE